LNPVAIDFETFYSKKLRYGLKQMIPEQYCAHELFDPYLISVSDGSQCWSGPRKDFNWDSIKGRPLLSHNARFDKAVYLEMVKRGWAPALDTPSWYCTADLTSYLCNRRALQQAVEHLFGVRVSKEYRDVADGKNWPQDYSEAEREQIMAAGRSDALWCWKLWDKFSPQFPELERRLSVMTREQGMRGVQIDTGKLNDYIWQSHEMRLNTENLIPWIKESGEDDTWDEFNVKPTATKCIAEQCRRVGIPCPPVKGDDEEAYLAWEATYAPKHPWILALGAWRSINKLYKSFETIKERLSPEGVLPFSLKFFGAHTGRWSGDARINLQNQRKRPAVCNELGLLELSDKRVDAGLDEGEETGKLPSWMRYVIDFRSLIIPRPGKKMIVSDLSQIEPRVLAWLVGDWEFLKRVSAGDSPYVAHARTSMGFTGDKMDKNSKQYKLAKARILGLGYQCGWEKFIAMAQDLARLDITVDDPEWIEETNPFTGAVKKASGWGATSKQIVKDFRAQNPKIVALWERLGNSFKMSVGSDFAITLPNGRKLRYDRVRASTRIEKDKETGLPKRSTEYSATTDGRWKKFYGGKLTENLVQATARDVFAEHLIKLEDAGWTTLFSIHDEAVLEVDQNVTAKDVEQVMSYCPEWLRGCPISAEAKEVKHYLK
jgi:hypothetical protein